MQIQEIRKVFLSGLSLLTLVCSAAYGFQGQVSAATGTGTGSVTDTIHIDGRGGGQIFDGIGAVSAGGASRLLIDYAAPVRSDILDYLFKPQFGAGFRYLKTEIGGDGNSTCGAEPSFARTRAEMAHPNFNRGYEYWLMRSARDRNPKIELDALEWTMPGWFSSVWSKDNAQYILKFLEGAKKWGLNMQYIGGCWNEREYNRDWIVNIFRPLLNKSGFSHVKINAPEGSGKAWGVIEQLNKDTAFNNAVDVISYHYPVSYLYRDHKIDTPRGYAAYTKPKWSGEDFSLGGKSWFNALYLARNVLECYLKLNIAKVNLWTPIASMPDNACYSNTGIMKGATPFSGNYEVWPAIWAVAHFNQFVPAGWHYLDNGCGRLPGGGVYGTYKKPGRNADFSMVIVTGNEAVSRDFQLNFLAEGRLNIWKSDSLNQFVQQQQITVKNGVFSLRLAPRSIYSITTTTGQHKGAHIIPAYKRFPTVYKENFEGYRMDQAPLSPKYFYDNTGAFEVYKTPDGKGRLRQMLHTDIIHWIPDSLAFTFAAEGTEWEDGVIESNVMVEENAFNGVGYAGVIARSTYDKSNQSNYPYGYRLNVYKDGRWRLLAKSRVLAMGKIDTTRGDWHHLKLSLAGTHIRSYIDHKLVDDRLDTSYSFGAAGYNSGFNHAQFDDLSIDYKPAKGRLIIDGIQAAASSETWGQLASNAVDGNTTTQWQPALSDTVKRLLVTLDHSYLVNACILDFSVPLSSFDYQLQYSQDKHSWKELPPGVKIIKSLNHSVIIKADFKAKYIRVKLLNKSGQENVGIYQIRLYSPAS